MSENRKGLFAFATVLATVMVGQSAFAMPVFARKYQTSCVTCHESFPRLNGIGEAFRLNGYKFLNDEIYVKEEPVEMGDEAYRDLWPKAIWPTDIPGLPPISFVLKNEFSYDVGGTGDARTQFVAPEEVEIIGAGTLGEDISFHVEIEFEKEAEGRGGSATETGFTGWVQFEDIFGPDNAFNIRTGTVGMHEIGLFTARDSNRMTLNRYLYSSWRLPTPGQAAVDAAFGPGTALSANRFRLRAQPGIEINGFGKRWRYAVGVVNGNESVNDDNSEKDVYVQTAYKIGGQPFDGSAQSGDGSLGGPEPWRDDSLTLSLFGYYGTGTIVVAGMKDDDRFFRVGPGARWKHKDLALNGGFVFGHNDDPYGPLDTASVDSYSWFVEGEYVIFPWLTTTARYEALKLKLAGDAPGSVFIQSQQDVQRVIVSAKALIRANLSLTAEGRFYIEDERASAGGGGTNDDDEVALGMALAF